MVQACSLQSGFWLHNGKGVEPTFMRQPHTCKHVATLLCGVQNLQLHTALEAAGPKVLFKAQLQLGLLAGLLTDAKAVS